MPDEILLERLTWPEIQEALKEGYDTVVLFAGSIEQHGPHLPLCTDTVLGYELAERVARKMGKALVAPVIRPGLSEHHMAFKGTITLSRETFQSTVRDYVKSLARHGFKRLAITFSHGGNAGALNEILPQLANEFPEVEILAVTDIEAHAPFLRRQASMKARQAFTQENSRPQPCWLMTRTWCAGISWPRDLPETSAKTAKP